MADFITTDKPVLITGVLSFLGAHLVQQLMADGYHVRGTARPSPEFPTLINHLRATTDGLPGKLEIFQVDLLEDEDKWSRIFDGVEYVFHLASPHSCSSDNAEKELLIPIVEGTRRILNLCQQTSTVKKLVYTSCYVALADDFDSKKVYSEEDWNDNTVLQRNGYAYSKTTAEKLATAFCHQPGCHFRLVSIVPGALLGPPAVPRLSYSHDYIKVFLDGTVKRIVDLHYPIADVRDVASALVLAIRSPTVAGRYCLSNASLSVQEILQMTHETFPDLATPTKTVPNLIAKTVSAFDGSGNGEFFLHYVGKRPHVSSRRATSAGMFLRPSAQTIVDTVRYFLDHDLLASASSDLKKNCVLS